MSQLVQAHHGPQLHTHASPRTCRLGLAAAQLVGDQPRQALSQRLMAAWPAGTRQTSQQRKDGTQQQRAGRHLCAEGEQVGVEVGWELV